MNEANLFSWRWRAVKAATLFGIAVLVVAQLDGVTFGRGYGSGSLGRAIRANRSWRSGVAAPIGGPTVGQRIAIGTPRTPYINIPSPAGVSFAARPSASVVLGGPDLGLVLTPGAGGPAPAAGPSSRPFTFMGTSADSQGGQSVPLPRVAPQVVLDDLQKRLADMSRLPFSPEWYEHYPRAWRPNGGELDPWSTARWAAVASWLGVASEPSRYDFAADSSGALQAFRNGERLGLAVHRRQTATDIANAGGDGDSENRWMSLGVFAFVPPNQATSDGLIQFFVSPGGVIRGSVCELLSGAGGPIAGSIDRSSQVAAWQFGGEKAEIMETGLSSLSENTSRLLLHRSDGWTQIWLMVRVDKDAQPDPDSQQTND